MQEIHKLRSQISRIVSANYPDLQAALFTAKLLPPSETQLKVLRQLLTAAFIDQVALRKDLVLPGEFSNADRYPSTRGVPYRAVGVDKDVFIHPSSVLFHNAPPECVVYQELTRTSKVYLRGKSRTYSSCQHSLMI
jgi:ATP-dependent RNA helicase DHX37/DHR1